MSKYVKDESLEEAPIVVEEELEIAPAAEPVVEEPKSKKSSAKFDKDGNKILGKTVAE